MDTKNSPRPWSARGAFLYDADGIVIGMTEFNSDNLPDNQRGIELNDAALIVAAVNSYAEREALLGECLVVVRATVDALEGGASLAPSLHNLRALLARLDGGNPSAAEVMDRMLDGGK